MQKNAVQHRSELLSLTQGRMKREDTNYWMAASNTRMKPVWTMKCRRDLGADNQSSRNLALSAAAQCSRQHRYWGRYGDEWSRLLIAQHRLLVVEERRDYCAGLGRTHFRGQLDGLGSKTPFVTYILCIFHFFSITCKQKQENGGVEARNCSG